MIVTVLDLMCYLLGVNIHEILREAIQVETIRLLNPDTYSSASDTGDSADENIKTEGLFRVISHISIS